MRALQLSPSGASWVVSWGQLDALVVPEVVAVPEVAVASWVAPLPVMSLLAPLEASWGYQVVASLSAAATEAAAATPRRGLRPSHYRGCRTCCLGAAFTLGRGCRRLHLRPLTGSWRALWLFIGRPAVASKPFVMQPQ